MICKFEEHVSEGIARTACGEIADRKSTTPILIKVTCPQCLEDYLTSLKEEKLLVEKKIEMVKDRIANNV